MKNRKKSLKELINGKVFKLNFTEKKFVDYVFTKVNEIVKSKLSEEKEDMMADSLREHLKKINKEIENYVNAIKFGIITETVKNQLILDEKKREEIENKLRNLNNKIVQFPDITYPMIRDYLKNLHSTLSYHPVLGRDFLSQIIEKIILKPFEDKIGITISSERDGILNGKSIKIVLNKITLEKLQLHEKDVA